jgi:hypothetical protein
MIRALPHHFMDGTWNKKIEPQRATRKFVIHNAQNAPI